MKDTPPAIAGGFVIPLNVVRYGKIFFPELSTFYAYRKPKSTPWLADTLSAWRAVTRETVLLLEKLTTADLKTELLRHRKSDGQSDGSAIYHYWYHIGEVQAIRQLLGHRDLPEHVGALEERAPYRS